MSKIRNLTEEEFDDFLFEGCLDNVYYTDITGEKYHNLHRWCILTSQIKKHEDGTFWEIMWKKPATEMQDGQEYNATIKQVFPITKEVTVYE